MSTPLLDLVVGVRDRLIAAGIPKVTIGDDGADNVTALTPYVVSDGSAGVLLSAVQVRLRVPARASDIGGGIGELLRRQQAVKDVLVVTDELVGEVTVASSWRQVSTPVQSSNGRPTLADSYYFQHDDDRED